MGTVQALLVAFYHNVIAPYYGISRPINILLGMHTHLVSFG